MANQRHELILNLIETNEVTTQEMLRDLLNENGVAVTQATISRDIRQLGLKKKRSASGQSCYFKATASPSVSNRFLNDLVVSIDYAVNTVVITCHAGAAQAACAALDRMQIREIVGTIAGDDTIFAITRSEASARQVVYLLESRIWG